MPDVHVASCAASWLRPYLTAGVGIAGTFVGVVGGYWVRGLEGRKSEISARIADAVQEVSSVQATAVRYWSRDTSGNDGRPDTDDIAQEGEIVGRLHLISVIVGDLQRYILPEHATELRSALYEFRATITGNGFASRKGHPADPQAIGGSFRSGARLVLSFRHAGREYGQRWWRLGPRRE